MAAIAALEEGEAFLAEFNARCRRNAELVMATLGRASARPAAGAGRAPSTPSRRIEGVSDSLAFARRVLAEAKVGIAAGYTFGPGNEDHVRLCFAIGTERLEEALRRVIAVLDR